ncbi:TonB-dependent receptor [Paludibacter sp. 221]|uniref:TonB-dependent receptor n=1 Tax=Paludibacter sp. 221 TaxID=2302939 RepID=UPI0013D72D45|nr:TonB-dependent receptor [Paludibacter sp. 221]
MKYIFLSVLSLIGISLTAQNIINQNDTITLEIEEINIYSPKPSADKNMLYFPTANISKTTLQTPSFFTPADALQQKAGISLTRDGIWATSVNVRGLAKERILILADGERIQTATDIAAALSTIDLNSLERIEVIKGAASVLYGTGAMGGAINFVTEKPVYTPSLRTSGKVGTGFNTVNKLWTSHAKIQLTDNNWYIAANGSYRMAQNTQTPEGVLENSQFNDASFGVQGGMTYDESQELLVNFQHYQAWDVGMPGGSAFHESAKVRYRNVKRNLLSGEYIFYEPVAALKEFRIKAYTQNISRDVENYREDMKLNVLPSSKNTTSGGKITVNPDLMTPYRNLTVGVEGWVRNAETQRYKIKERSEDNYLVTAEQPVPNAKMIDIGAFAQYSWDILPGKLKMDAGLRLDDIAVRNDSAFDPVFQYTKINGERTDIGNIQRKLMFAAGNSNEFSYAAHIDLMYRFARNHKTALSLSNAYRAASLEERFKFIDLANSTTVQMGNPNLKPEKGLFANLNYTYSGERFDLKTDVFANYLFDLITEKRVNGVGRDTLKNVNIDNALFIGAEIEANYRFTNSLWAMANASYTRARDVNNDEPLPMIPPLKGMVELNYRYKNRFTASVSANWAARQSEVATGESPTNGHIILNAAIRSERIKLTPMYHLQLFAGADNILNTAYYNHLSTTRGIIKLEPGRNIYAKIQFGW